MVSASVLIYVNISVSISSPAEKYIHTHTHGFHFDVITRPPSAGWNYVGCINRAPFSLPKKLTYMRVYTVNDYS